MGGRRPRLEKQQLGWGDLAVTLICLGLASGPVSILFYMVLVIVGTLALLSGSCY